MPRGSGDLYEDFQRPPHERPGFGEVVGGLKQPGEVVEGGGDIGMVLAEGGLVDGEGLAHERLGLGEAVGGFQQLCEVVEAGGDVRVVLAKA